MLSFISRIRKTTNPPTVKKTENPLRVGLLGASRIAPDAIIKPARCHEDVLVTVVAARNKSRAEEYAHKWSIPKFYGGESGYQDLLDDAELDVVYIGLPNALHYEWTMKALNAGKHVMCDKPIADNEEETRRMFSLAEEKGLVLLETWQPQFHPAIKKMKDIIDEGSLGEITKMYAHFGLWGNVMFKKDDIRYDYKLGGGALMDLGPYPINYMRFLSASEPTVQSAEAICRSENVDRRMETELLFRDSIPATVIVDLSLDGWGPFKLLPQWVKIALRVECEKGSVEIWNYPLPSLWHSITVKTQDGRRRVEKVYKPTQGKGEEWWSAYRYQLESFVDKLRGRSPVAWRTAEDSINEMRVIDAVYSKSGLALRPTSSFGA